MGGVFTLPSHPLCDACNSGDLAKVKQLITQEHADVSSKNSGWAPIHVAAAASHDNAEIVRFLVDSGADVHDKNMYMEDALHVAAYKGNLKIVQYLVDEAGADIFAKNKIQKTAADYAFENGRKQLLEFLQDRMKGNKLKDEAEFAAKAKYLTELVAKYGAAVPPHIIKTVVGEHGILDKKSFCKLSQDDVEKMKIPASFEIVLLGIIKSENEISMASNTNNTNRVNTTNNNTIVSADAEDPATASQDQEKQQQDPSSSSSSSSSPAPPQSSSPLSTQEGSTMLPAARCFKRCQTLGLDDAVKELLSLRDVPPGRPDLASSIPDDNDALALIAAANHHLTSIRDRPAVQKLIKENGLTDDDIKVLFLYKSESPYELYRHLNCWLMTNRRDAKIKNAVGPFFTLLYRAMEKLPKVQARAARSVIVKNIPALRATFANYSERLAPGKTLAFWGFSSFSTDDAVINSQQFMGALDDDAIVYICGSLEGVDMEPFAPDYMSSEKEILPMCPAVFEVQNAVMIGAKLSVSLKHVGHKDFAYVDPK